MEQTVHQLGTDDIERLLAIDFEHTGHVRRRFFEKRLAAAKEHPEDFVPIGVTRGGSLCGFVIARLLRGEFGHNQDVAVLDAIGVESESQERGIGLALMQQLGQELHRRGISSLESQAGWANHPMLRFFEAAGFTLAPRLVLERLTAQNLAEASEEM